MRKLLIFLAGLALAAPAYAVSTSHWVQANEADFKAGTMHNVVVTNLGDVKLSRAVQTIKEQDPDVTAVNALAEGPDGVIYAGTGPKGILLAVKNDKVTTAATLDNTVSILALAVDDRGALLLGTGGDKGRVLRIDKPGDKPKEIFSHDGVQYIWALLQTPDGNIYAATGPNGQVFEIKPDGSSSELYKSSEDNITSMISDGKDLLYLGTDPNGMVVRVNRKTRQSFIVYNAGETEITALAMDSDGNLYAATGEAGERQPPQQPEQEEKNAGRPERENNVSPIPANPTPTPPKPPPVPNPNPGEPKPIPRKRQSIRLDPTAPPQFMDIMAGAGGKDDPGDGGNQPGGDQPGGDQPGGDQPGGDQPGGDQPGPGDNSNAAPPASDHSNANPAPANPGDQPQGNAIYKIDKDGFVTEIFRQNVVIYSMILQGDVLLVGTGEDGNIYQVNPAEEETVVLAKVNVKQITCLLAARDGRIFMGLANTGGIAVMTGGYAPLGTYVSPVLDATQVSRFGKIHLHGQLPDATSLKVATRSGNVKDADAPGWSSWSPDVGAQEYVKIAAPSARFLQYRLTFATSDSTATALVDHVDVAYQIPNMAPVIKSVKIGAGDNSDANAPEAGAQGGTPSAPAGHADSGAKPQGGTATQTITWDASDPNNDALVYTLYYRMDESGPWILLKDNLKDPTFDWDTRTVADGRYQIKVVASDALANPPGQGKTASRISDYFVVNNTAPVIGDLAWKIDGNQVKIELRAQDRTSIVANVEYAVDSNDDWQAVLPVDNIFDSPDETVRFTITGLTPGPHQVAIRATDSVGNQSIQIVTVKVEGAAAPGK